MAEVKEQAKTDEKPKAKFLLMAGKHHRGSQQAGTRVTVEPGQVFEAMNENEAIYCRKYPDRYQEVRSEVYPVVKARVSTVGAAEPEIIEIDMENLARMNIIQLLNFTKQNGIDTKGAKDKDSILKAIREAASE